MSDNGSESIAMLMCKPFTVDNGGVRFRMLDGDCLITAYYFVKSACPGHAKWSDRLEMRVHLHFNDVPVPV